MSNNHKCPICKSDLVPGTLSAMEDLYCFNHIDDFWYGVIVSNNQIVRMAIQFPYLKDVVRIIYWPRTNITYLTDRFENPLAPAINFKPDFENFSALKEKIKTWLVFS